MFSENSYKLRIYLDALVVYLQQEPEYKIDLLLNFENILNFGQTLLQRMEEVRQKMLDSSQLSVERMKTKLERQQLQRLAEKEEELRVNFASKICEFEDAKQFELEEVKEKVRKKSKMEIETLRSRFKMMQATGTMERSPSVSESEFTMEVSFEDL